MELMGNVLESATIASIDTLAKQANCRKLKVVLTKIEEVINLENRHYLLLSARARFGVGCGLLGYLLFEV